MVILDYCTGDEHSGSNDAVHTKDNGFFSLHDRNEPAKDVIQLIKKIYPHLDTRLAVAIILRLS